VTAAVRDAEIDAAVILLAAGGVVAYPTETVYGLAVDASSADAIASLVALKGRDAGRGISLLVSNLEMAAPLVAGPIPDAARLLVERFWPGPLTIVVPASAGACRALVGPSGGVGLRCSTDPWASELVRHYGAPLTSTSANRSGMEAARSADEVREAFRDVIEADAPGIFVLDGGARRSSQASTVIEF
jgi:L-threonylcarbamoyladenylate synthase